jgi:MinD-like ATPase involved in chromosome partitioning or flagellar assembly
VPINTATVMFTLNAFDPLIVSIVDSFQIENYFPTLKIVVFLILQFVVYLIVTFVSISIPDQVFEVKVNKERAVQVLSNLALIEQQKESNSKLIEAQNTIQEQAKYIQDLEDYIQDQSEEEDEEDKENEEDE